MTTDEPTNEPTPLNAPQNGPRGPRRGLEAQETPPKALAIVLEEVLVNDGDPPDYEARNHLVYVALLTALECGYYAGIRLDPEEPRWPVIYIELPTGQISWHVPEHLFRWDTHTKEEATERVRQFIAAQGAP